MKLADRLISAEEISYKVQDLAMKIEQDSPLETITFLVCLKGSLVFTADLIRQIQKNTEIEFTYYKSYRGMKGGTLDCVMPATGNYSGKDVVIVDDILDSGSTLDRVFSSVLSRDPRNVRAVTLLRKEKKRETRFSESYFGFMIPDKFVVGYGLDYNGLYRNLPDIWTITK